MKNPATLRLLKKINKFCHTLIFFEKRIKIHIGFFYFRSNYLISYWIFRTRLLIKINVKNIFYIKKIGKCHVKLNRCDETFSLFLNMRPNLLLWKLALEYINKKKHVKLVNKWSHTTVSIYTSLFYSTTLIHSFNFLNKNIKI